VTAAVRVVALSGQGGSGMLRAMSARPLPAVALCVSLFAGLGCAYGEVRQVVRAQFASELDCPEVFILKRDAWYQYENPNQFKVTGCGVMRTYTCPKEASGRVSYDEPACTWVEGDADAPKMAEPVPEDGAMQDAEGIEPLDESPPEPLESEPADDEDKPEADDDGLGDDSDLGADAEGSTSVKPATKKAGASGQAGGSLRIGTGKKK
jgi:hypothetical protein